MNKLLFLFCINIFTLLLCGVALAHEGHGEIPAKVSMEHWSCKEIAELATKYGALNRLPADEVLEKRALVAPLLAIIDKVLEKCGKDGTGAVPAEDLAQIAVLYEALKEELAQYEG
ncbi:MAG TPA: hypothetical protein VN642_04140, partial [Dongiaceae bacterium]|nr:hypothetical protein [Dongiaceae bacterium]